MLSTGPHSTHSTQNPTALCFFSLFVDLALHPRLEIWYWQKVKEPSQVSPAPSAPPALPHCQSSSPPSSSHSLPASAFNAVLTAPAAASHGGGLASHIRAVMNCFWPQVSWYNPTSPCQSRKMSSSRFTGEEQLQGLKPRCPEVCRHFLYCTVRCFALLRIQD